MKRHVQQPGVRQWAGEDLIELQSEPLKALDGFFSEYGSCIIQGCQVTDNGNGTYDISAGLLALAGTDVNGSSTFKIVPFSGVTDVPFPVYFKLAYSIVERSYLDGQVKPIAYNYRAEVSTVQPEGECLELSEDNVIRFVDVIQCDSLHRFFSDSERLKLKGIAAGANNYTHPTSHPASMIAEGVNKRFMTDAERTSLSSLETYAKKDFSNITSKSMGQNGYYKLPDGLLVQWGYSSTSGRNKTIYLPHSFYDTTYKVMIAMCRISDNTTNLTSDVYTKNVSSFSMFGLYHATDTNNGAYSYGFDWIAVGRWK